VVAGGHTLQGHPGDWQTLTSIHGYSYRWCRVSGLSCTTLASGPTYTIPAPVIGARIKLVVTATDDVGSTDAESDPTAPVAANPPNATAPPTMSGTAREGERLTRSSYGSWTDPSPSSYSVQWLRCNSAGAACVAIAGASDDGYGVAAADVGHRIRLRVIATGPYGSGSALSAATSAIGKRPAARAKPKKPKRLSPFPRIVVAGSLSSAGAIFRRVTVKGPRNVTVRVRCRGHGCPYRSRSYRMRTRKLRVRSLERRFSSGVMIEVRVVKKGRVGKYTRIRIRRGRIPSRVDRCLNPGSSRPRKCK
jgi:hypothetical protein